MPLTELDINDGLDINNSPQENNYQHSQPEDIPPRLSMTERLSTTENRNSSIITRSIFLYYIIL